MTVPRLAIDPFDEAFPADPAGLHPALRDAGPVVRRLNNVSHALASLPVERVPA